MSDDTVTVESSLGELLSMEPAAAEGMVETIIETWGRAYPGTQVQPYQDADGLHFAWRTLLDEVNTHLEAWPTFQKEYDRFREMNIDLARHVQELQRENRRLTGEASRWKEQAEQYQNKVKQEFDGFLAREAARNKKMQAVQTASPVQTKEIKELQDSLAKLRQELANANQRPGPTVIRENPELRDLTDFLTKENEILRQTVDKLQAIPFYVHLYHFVFPLWLRLKFRDFRAWLKAKLRGEAQS